MQLLGGWSPENAIFSFETSIIHTNTCVHTSFKRSKSKLEKYDCKSSKYLFFPSVSDLLQEDQKRTTAVEKHQCKITIIYLYRNYLIFYHELILFFLAVLMLWIARNNSKGKTKMFYMDTRADTRYKPSVYFETSNISHCTWRRDQNANWYNIYERVISHHFITACPRHSFLIRTSKYLLSIITLIYVLFKKVKSELLEGKHQRKITVLLFLLIP